MIDKVDAGAIVGVERFTVPPDASVQAIEELAYLHLARLLWKLAGGWQRRASRCVSLQLFGAGADHAPHVRGDVRYIERPSSDAAGELTRLTSP